MRATVVVWLSLVCCLVPAGIATGSSPDLTPLVQALRRVGPEGKGHVAATSAWAELTEQAGATDLPIILSGMDGAGPLAVNWLRAAVDTVAERQLRDGGSLPTAALERFLSDERHNPRARRLAYEWITRVDAGAPDRLIPGMLDDPSLELRRDAVARLLAAAKKSAEQKQKTEALATYRQALDAARDLDQVKEITEALDELGQGVDLPHHYGFVQDWQLLGPFDNRDGNGFDAVYPPEESIDFKASYDTPEGTLTWKPHRTDHEYGIVDLNKAIGKHMGVAGYAAAVFHSERGGPIEIRVGSENAVKIFLNGELLASSEAYHANEAIDQYAGSGELRPGRNLILIKVCQNEMTVEWAQDWKFQLRACDASGKAVLSTDRPKPNPPAKKEATQSKG